MIILLLKLLLILVIILIIISIININKYNKNSKLIKLDSFNDIYKNKRALDPLLFDNLDVDLDVDIIKSKPNNYYEENNTLIRLNDFEKDKDINIYENNKLILDFSLTDKCDYLYDIFSGYLYYNKQYFGSLLQNSYESKLKKNSNNLLLIGNIFGNCNILLINPKHKEDIENQDINNLKKWSIITNLKKNELLYIPTNWYYLIEIIDFTFLFHIKSDSIFTFFYNKYRY
tara:strand:+ start:2661 stop:3350 length:690 start_codon:yes stop_codon:yes gene_type:complete